MKNEILPIEAVEDEQFNIETAIHAVADHIEFWIDKFADHDDDLKRRFEVALVALYDDPKFQDIDE